MTDVQGSVESAADDARDEHGHRIIFALVAAALMCFLLLGGLFIWRSATTQAELDSQSALIAQQNRAGEALKDQVLQLGGTPVTQPPPVTGVAGPQGIQGLKGDKGDPGKDGVNGTNGQSPPCLSTPTQCQGAPGANGQNGADGQPGKDGVDGAQGPQGVPGQKGDQGPPGPTCPAGYTLTPVIVVGMDGKTHQGVVCVQDAPAPSSSKTARKG